MAAIKMVRTPPFAINPEMERAALGGLLIVPEHLVEAAKWLQPKDFQTHKHVVLYAAMLALLEQNGTPPDVVQLDEYLRANKLLAKIGGSGYTNDLVSTCPTLLHILDYCRTVFTLSLEHQKRLIGESIAANGITIDEAQRRLAQLQERARLAAGGADGQQDAAADVVGTIISNIEKQPIHWLWPGYLAQGKVAIIDGDPGLGKGLLSIDLAARMTRGRPMPGEIHGQEPSNVIMLTPEDDPADTIRPRLEVAGADLDRIRVLNMAPGVDGRDHFMTIPRDVPQIEKAIIHDNARLLIIDPITACLDSGVKIFVDTEVRAALMPLVDLAMRTGCVILLVRHLNKGGGDNALYRGGGSIAFAGLVRTAMVLARHPDDEKMRVLAVSKTNLPKEPPALAFSLVSDDPDAWPRVVWEDEPCDLKANELLGTNKSSIRRDIVRALRAASAPLSTPDIAAALEIDAADEKKMANLRKVLERMYKGKEIVKESRGRYTLSTSTPLSQQSHMSNKSQVSQVSQNIMGEFVTDVTDVTVWNDATPDLLPVTNVTPMRMTRNCIVCGKPMVPHADGAGYWPCNH